MEVIKILYDIGFILYIQQFNMCRTVSVDGWHISHTSLQTTLKVGQEEESTPSKMSSQHPISSARYCIPPRGFYFQEG